METNDLHEHRTSIKDLWPQKEIEQFVVNAFILQLLYQNMWKTVTSTAQLSILFNFNFNLFIYLFISILSCDLDLLLKDRVHGWLSKVNPVLVPDQLASSCSSRLKCLLWKT